MDESLPLPVSPIYDITVNSLESKAEGITITDLSECIISVDVDGVMQGTILGQNFSFTLNQLDLANLLGFSTSDLAEGTNQYFTNSRAVAAVSAGVLSGFSTSDTTPTFSGLSTGVGHFNVSGELSSSLIVDADITNGTITDAKLATISTVGKVANSATSASTLNSNNTIVLRDGSGNIAANTIECNNLNVMGTTTTISTSSMIVSDAFIKIAKDNTGNLVDMGFYGQYYTVQDDPSTVTYTGFFWDNDSSAWYLFDNIVGVVNEPLNGFSPVSPDVTKRGTLNVWKFFATNTTSTSFLSENGSGALPAVGVGAVDAGLYNTGSALGFSYGGASRATLSSSLFTLGTSTGLQIPAGAVATPSLSFASSTTTGLYASGNTLLGLSVGGVWAGTVSTTSTAVGYQAMVSSSGARNTAFGYQSIYLNTTGTDNTAVGYSAGYSGGIRNTSVGVNGLYSANTGATDNTGVGYGAGQWITTGDENVCIGNLAGGGSSGVGSGGSSNTSVGSKALLIITSGGSNTAVGQQALVNNVSGSMNTGVGSLALQHVTGDHAQALGYLAGSSWISGNNVYVGYLAGYNASQSASTGQGNLFLGHQAGNFNSVTASAGNNNTIVGTSAASTTYIGMTNCTYLGYNVQPSSATASNEIIIGAGTTNCTINATTLTTLTGPLQLSAGAAATPSLNFASSATTGLYASGNTLLGLSANAVGIATINQFATTGIHLDVTPSATTTVTGTGTGIKSGATFTTATASANLIGISSVPTFTVTGTPGTVTRMSGVDVGYILSANPASQTISTLAGIYNNNSFSNAGTLTNVYGIYNNTTVSANTVTTGTISNLYGEYITNNIASNAGTFSNLYGLYVDAGSGASPGTIGAAYGAYILQPTTGTVKTATFTTNLAVGSYAGTAPPANGAIISGAVGIGTSSVTSNGCMLDVRATASNSYPHIRIAAPATGFGSFFDFDATPSSGGSNWRIQSSAGTASEGTGKFLIQLVGTGAMFSMLSTGFVGIGSGLITPLSRLSVAGNTAIGSTYGATSGTGTAAPANGLLVQGAGLFGTTALSTTNTSLQVSNAQSVAGAATSYGILSNGTHTASASTVTAMYGMAATPTWAPNTFTVTSAAGMYINTANTGTGNITSSYGLLIGAGTTSATVTSGYGAQINMPLAAATTYGLNIAGSSLIAATTTYGVYVNPSLGTNNTGTLYGLNVLPAFTITGAVVSPMIAISSLSNTITNASGTATAIYGQKINLTTAGTTTASYGQRITMAHTVGGVCTNQYGLKVEAGTTSVGTVTNAYGGHFTVPTAGGTINAALYADNMVIGTSGVATKGKLNLTDTTQVAARLVLSGQEFYQPANTSTDGIAFLIGVNRAGNRQLWIADSASLTQNATNMVIRFTPNSGGVNYITAQTTDGSVAAPLEIGSTGASGALLNLNSTKTTMLTQQSVSSGTAYGINMTPTLTQTAAATLIGLQLAPVYTVTGAITATMLAGQTISNTITNASGTVSAIYGQKIDLTTAGTTTAAYGKYTKVVHTAAGTCANQYGIYADINTKTAGTVTNSYGGYFRTPTAGGTANIALYSDNLCVNTSTPIAGSAITINNPASSAVIYLGQTSATFANSILFKNSSTLDTFYVGQDGVGLTGGTAGNAVIATWTNKPITFFANTAEVMRISSGQVAVGTTTPDTSAIVDISSTTKSLLPPRMTTAQKTAIGTPAAGSMVYDTSLSQTHVYNGSSWQPLQGTAGIWTQSLYFNMTSSNATGVGSALTPVAPFYVFKTGATVGSNDTVVVDLVGSVARATNTTPAATTSYMIYDFGTLAAGSYQVEFYLHTAPANGIVSIDLGTWATPGTVSTYSTVTANIATAVDTYNATYDVPVKVSFVFSLATSTSSVLKLYSATKNASSSNYTIVWSRLNLNVNQTNIYSSGQGWAMYGTPIRMSSFTNLASNVSGTAVAPWYSAGTSGTVTNVARYQQPSSGGYPYVYLAGTQGVGDYIQYDFGTLPAGTYQLCFSVVQSTDRAIISIQLGTNTAGSFAGSLVSTLASNIDMYDVGSSNGMVDYVYSFTVLSAARRVVQFIVTGKNASSSNYYMLISRLEIFQQQNTVTNFQQAASWIMYGTPIQMSNVNTAVSGVAGTANTTPWYVYSATLASTASASVWTSVSGYLDPYISIYGTAAVGDYIQYDFGTLPAGTYTFTYIDYIDTDRATYSVTLSNGFGASFTAGLIQTLASSVDAYSSKTGAQPLERSYTFALGQADRRVIQMLVTGKNASSSSYKMTFGKFQILQLQNATAAAVQGTAWNLYGSPVNVKSATAATASGTNAAAVAPWYSSGNIAWSITVTGAYPYIQNNNTNGQYLDYDFGTLPAGTYRLDFMTLLHTDRCQFSVTLGLLPAGSYVADTTLTSLIDGYTNITSGIGNMAVDYSYTFTNSVSQRRVVRFLTSGKNASSSAYWLTLGRIQLFQLQTGIVLSGLTGAWVQQTNINMYNSTNVFTTATAPVAPWYSSGNLAFYANYCITGGLCVAGGVLNDWFQYDFGTLAAGAYEVSFALDTSNFRGQMTMDICAASGAAPTVYNNLFTAYDCYTSNSTQQSPVCLSATFNVPVARRTVLQCKNSGKNASSGAYTVMLGNLVLKKLTLLNY